MMRPMDLLPGDLAIDKEKIVLCPDCKTKTPFFEGPIHEYLGASAGCWKIFGEILAKEYSDSAYRKFHRWTVDAYAAQHPGKPEPRTIQSINIHLLALYLLIERKAEPSFVTRLMGLIVEKNKCLFQWLNPPDPIGAITVLDIAQARSPEEHGEMVKAWAHSVWEAWGLYHERVEEIAKEFL